MNMSNVTKLNSTGSFKMINGDYFSYNTRLSGNYKGYLFINKSYYSHTTRKHQGNLPAVPYNQQLENCSYGNWNIQEQIEKEVLYLNDKLDFLQKKRKTQKNKTMQEKIKEKITFLKSLIED